MELSLRLECALSLVRENSRVYDIGSDHGYLPCALVTRGICKSAVVTDVNKGPLERAKKTFLERGIYESAQFYLTDGLSGLTFEDGKCDVCICGMGGELIASIIEARPDIWEADVSFVLQPMTRAHVLREFLWSRGFEIQREIAVTDADKPYVVMKACYTGEATEYTEAELYLGKRDARQKSQYTEELIDKLILSFERKCQGMRQAGHDVSQLERLIVAFKEEKEFIN